MFRFMSSSQVKRVSKKEPAKVVKSSASNHALSSMSSGGSSEEDDVLHDSDDVSRYDPPDVFYFIRTKNFKTDIACILFCALSHYVYGTSFNAYETANSKYNYPNVGSMCFVLATAIYLSQFDLNLKSVPIERRTWKYPLYKVLAVTFLTHLILGGIWQQLVNLTWEIVFIFKEFLDFGYSKTGILALRSLSSYVNMSTARFVTHVEGFSILACMLYSLH